MAPIPSKTSKITKFLIWFYRVLFMTFGGIAINSEDKLYINKYLKYYGYCGLILIPLSNIIAFYISMSKIPLDKNPGLVVTYYVSLLINGLQVFHVSANLWFMNRNGFRFFEIFYNRKIELNKNQIIIFITWICHILLPIIMNSLNFIDQIYRGYGSIELYFFLQLFRFCGFIAIWAVPFLTWFISLHFNQYMIQIEQYLIQKLYRNSGNH